MSFSKNITWSPVDYADQAVLAREVGEEMLSRLEWITLKPAVILEVGCGTGEMSVRLQQCYPDAQILSTDVSEPMIDYAKHQTKASACVCADSEKLPLKDQSVDFIFANLLLPWQSDYLLQLKEWRRVLRPDGLLMFTAFGPDTLREWRDMFHDEHIPNLIDMHDVGDAMLKEGFADPVLDVSYFTMTYSDKEKLIAELYVTGMLVAEPDLSGLKDIVLEAGDKLSVTYEVAYAHAFVPPPKNEFGASSDGLTRVPLSHLRRQIGSR